MAKTIGVVLAGCGVIDGAEIHEAVLTLLALDRAGVRVVCMAPNIDQMHVVNHAKGEPAAGERRNVLVEAARIARGDIIDIAKARGVDLDGLIFAGGFGAAKNLCDYAVRGEKMKVHPEVERLILEMHGANKPIGFMCIAPVIAAKTLGKMKVRLTIGTDDATARDIVALGAIHEPHQANEICVDKAMRVVSTPAYMTARRISEAAEGIEKLVREVLAMA